jgi:hypothetical protein
VTCANLGLARVDGGQLEPFKHPAPFRALMPPCMVVRASLRRPRAGT